MAGLSLGNKNPRTKTGCKRKQDMMTFELNFNRNHKKISTAYELVIWPESVKSSFWEFL